MKEQSLDDEPIGRRRPAALTAAHALVLLVPLALMAGALGFQYLGGLTPCELCMWQRYPLMAAIALALAALTVRNARTFRTITASAVGAIATSGAIAIHHLGVERHFWRGFTACTSSIPKGLSGDELLRQILRMPLHRCDTPQWTLAGLSLADLNAVVTLSTAALAALLIARIIRKAGA